MFHFNVSEDDSGDILNDLVLNSPRLVLQKYCSRHGIPLSFTTDQIPVGPTDECRTASSGMRQYETICVIGDRKFRGKSVNRKKDAIDSVIMEALIGYFNLDRSTTENLVKNVGFAKPDLVEKTACQILNEICAHSEQTVEFKKSVKKFDHKQHHRYFTSEIKVGNETFFGSGNT